MRRLSIVLALLVGTGFCAEPIRLAGKIAAYDWYQHEQTASDTFILKLSNSSDVARYGRYVLVVYKRYWGFDAPNEVSRSEMIPRLAFLGRGATWNFRLAIPDDEQEFYCTGVKKSGLVMQIEDEEGAVKVSRLVPTIGTDPATIPAIADLKCLVLMPNGWTKQN